MILKCVTYTFLTRKKRVVKWYSDVQKLRTADTVDS